MGIKFFGQYLLEKGVIGADGLLKAIAMQESRNLKLGQYALTKGYLKHDDVERLNARQKSTDMRIGELAVKMGLLSAAHVDELLIMQKNDHLQIGEALVLCGALERGEMERQIEAFKADQAEFAPSAMEVPDGMASPADVRDMADLTLKLLKRIGKMEVKAEKVSIAAKGPEPAYAAVSIRFFGGASFEYVITSPELSARLISAGIIGEDMSRAPREDIVDGLKEFANIVCGNVMARFAQRGKNVDMTPPDLIENGADAVKGRKAARYPLVTTSGYIYLYIIEG